MTDHPANRRTTGQFQPGQSGNPSGRPKLAPEMYEMCRAASPAAISRVIELLGHADPNIAIKAATLLLDRGYGRPVASHEVSGPGGGPIHTFDLSHVTDEQLILLVSVFEPLLGVPAGG